MHKPYKPSPLAEITPLNDSDISCSRLKQRLSLQPLQKAHPAHSRSIDNPDLSQCFKGRGNPNRTTMAPQGTRLRSQHHHTRSEHPDKLQAWARK